MKYCQQECQDLTVNSIDRSRPNLSQPRKGHLFVPPARLLDTDSDFIGLNENRLRGWTRNEVAISI